METTANANHRDPILTDAELDVLSTPLAIPTSFEAWREAEAVASAFSEDESSETVLSESAQRIAREKVAARVRSALRNRPEQIARREVEAAGRRARLVFASLRRIGR